MRATSWIAAMRAPSRLRPAGITPRPGGALAGYENRLRDYCAAGDVAAQASPGSTVDGHVAYFHNGMPTDATRFVLDQLAQTTSHVAEPAR